MLPSDPPLANKFSCIGCQDTEKASFLWPRNTWLKDYTSHGIYSAQCIYLAYLHLLFQIPNIVEFDKVISRCRKQPVPVLIPLDIHNGALMRMTENELSQTHYQMQIMLTPTLLPNFGHSWGPIVSLVYVNLCLPKPQSPSLDAMQPFKNSIECTCWPWEEIPWWRDRYHHTCFTSAPWPRKILSSWQRKKSQTRTVPSSLAVTNLWSVGPKLNRTDGWFFRRQIKEPKFSVVNKPYGSACLVFMCLIHLNVIHVQLPVFNISLMVPGDKPTFMFWPSHSSDWRIMSLKLENQKPLSSTKALCRAWG